jgi:hypothetical protein
MEKKGRESAIRAVRERTARIGTWDDITKSVGDRAECASGAPKVLQPQAVASDGVLDR